MPGPKPSIKTRAPGLQVHFTAACNSVKNCVTYCTCARQNRLRNLWYMYMQFMVHVHAILNRAASTVYSMFDSLVPTPPKGWNRDYMF